MTAFKARFCRSSLLPLERSNRAIGLAETLTLYSFEHGNSPIGSHRSTELQTDRTISAGSLPSGSIVQMDIAPS